jgi:hypothetical protein
LTYWFATALALVLVFDALDTVFIVFIVIRVFPVGGEGEEGLLPGVGLHDVREVDVRRKERERTGKKSFLLQLRTAGEAQGWQGCKSPGPKYYLHR